jgi:phosphoribosylformylglycinamidine cyclo-ligase
MPSYRDAGVDTAEAARLVELIRRRASSSGTHGGIGGFGALFELPPARNPLLVSSTDGVGTKLEPALAERRYREIGRDCVAMCVNDILCHGARPLYFLDYLACGRLDAEVAAEIVSGMIDACGEIGCIVSGGETAEMPGVYAPGSYDVAGFVVGMVEADLLIDGTKVGPGDELIGIASNGVHSNGFSLIRTLELDWASQLETAPGRSERLGEILLRPTPLYVAPVLSLLERVAVHGIAHITGGGIPENVPRMTARTLRYEIERGALPVHPVFGPIAAAGVHEADMFRTFNMGVGMVLAVSPHDTARSVEHLAGQGLSAVPIGRVVEGDGVCIE